VSFNFLQMFRGGNPNLNAFEPSQFSGGPPSHANNYGGLGWMGYLNQFNGSQQFGNQGSQQNPGGLFGSVAGQVANQTGNPPLTQERFDALGATYDDGTPGSRGIGKMAELLREFYTGNPNPQ
jgi:hypothetical protein